MTPERFQQIAEVFRAASSRGGGARAVYLDEACGDDVGLRQEVERLLGSDDELPSMVLDETSAQPDAPIIDAAPNIPHVMPERIGRYRVRQMLEEGGMGRVYVAVQEQPRRTVALKVMKASIASKSALRRFEYEAQILSRLRHGNIAQVYEAGVHAEGDYRVPYFAMEYVPNAKPLTSYAVDKELGTRERVELFMKVCAAVHHGHQKGIIHRDLKPSNVLVDSGGEPKIIDFGVARATDSDMAVTTVQTDIGQLIGTVQYMSPEQCAADPHDLDTRSDVYALGVMLYELVTGTLPYDLSDLAMHEATRRIVEDMPARPSTLDKALRGDLETIVLKALEKDRDRRYQSSAELSADLGRYLAGESILARPPSVSYQVQMFARRNRVLVGAVGVVFVVLVAGIVATSTQMLRARDAEQRAVELADTEIALREDAEREAERARRVQQFLQRMLHSLNPGERPGYDPEFLRPMYDDASRWLELELADEPDVAAEIRVALGLSYLDLRDFAQASAHLEAAAEYQQRGGQDDVARARSLAALADFRFRQSQPRLAEELGRQALAIYERELGSDHESTVEQLISVGLNVGEQGRLEDAELLYRRALDTAERALGDRHRLTALSTWALGFNLDNQGRSEEAGPLLRRSVELRRRIFGDDHPHFMRALTTLGWNLIELGRFTEAESIFSQALKYFEKDEVRATGDPGRGLARSLVEQGRFDEAESLYTWILDFYRAHYTPDHRYIASVEREWGRCLIGLERYAEAETVLHRAHMWFLGRRGASDRYTRLAATRLAELYDAWGKPNEASEWRERIDAAGGPP